MAFEDDWNKIEPIVESDITFYKIEFPLKTKWDNVPERDTLRDTERDTLRDTERMLSEDDKTILNEIKKNPRVTSENLSGILNINLRNTKKKLSKLKEKGIVRRVGPDKGGYWEILND